MSTRSMSNRSLESNKYAESNYEKEGGQFGSNGEGLESPVSDVSGDSRRPSKMGRRTSVDLEEKLDQSHAASRGSMTSMKDTFAPSIEEKVAMSTENPSNNTEMDSPSQARVTPLHPVSSEVNNIASESFKSSGGDSTGDSVSLKGYFVAVTTSSLDTTNPSMSVGTKGPESDLTPPRPLSIPGCTPPRGPSPDPTLPLTSSSGTGPGNEVTLPLASETTGEKIASRRNSINRTLPVYPQARSSSTSRPISRRASFNAIAVTEGTGSAVGGIVDPEIPGSSRNELTFQPHELAQLESMLESPLTISKPTTARAYPSDSEPSVHGPVGIITTDTPHELPVPVTTGTGDWALDTSAVALALGNIKSAGGAHGIGPVAGAGVGAVAGAGAVINAPHVQVADGGEIGGEKSNGTVGLPPVSAIAGSIVPSSLSMLPSIVKTKKTWTDGKRDDDDDHSSVASTEYGSDIFADISMSYQAALEDTEDEPENTAESAAGALMMLSKGDDVANTMNAVHSDVPTVAVNSDTRSVGSTTVLPSIPHVTPSLPLPLPLPIPLGAVEAAHTTLPLENQTPSALPSKPNVQNLDPLENLSESDSFSSGMKSLSAASTLPSDVAQTPRGPVSNTQLLSHSFFLSLFVSHTLSSLDTFLSLCMYRFQVSSSYLQYEILISQLTLYCPYLKSTLL